MPHLSTVQPVIIAPPYQEEMNRLSPSCIDRKLTCLFENCVEHPRYEGEYDFTVQGWCPVVTSLSITGISRVAGLSKSWLCTVFLTSCVGSCCLCWCVTGCLIHHHSQQKIKATQLQTLQRNKIEDEFSASIQGFFQAQPFLIEQLKEKKVICIIAEYTGYKIFNPSQRKLCQIKKRLIESNNL